MAVELLRQLRAAALGPVSLAFRLDRAPHEPGILGRELTNLTLHVVDHDALFGNLVHHGGDPAGHSLPLTDADKLVEDIAMIGIDGVAADAGFASELCNGQMPDGGYRRSARISG